jgi:hypothetical protein
VPDLRFSIAAAEAVPNAASPQIVFRIAIENKTSEEIRNVLLQTQVRIDPMRRRYSPGEQVRLYELFGEPSQWGKTLHSMPWHSAIVMVKPFTGSTIADLVVPCTFDFNVAATKYFHELDDGDIPLTFLFSGSVFYSGAGGALQLAQISWESEAAYRLPVAVWKKMMDLYYPNSAWLCLRRDVFDRLLRVKRENAFTSFDQLLESFL